MLRVSALFITTLFLCSCERHNADSVFDNYIDRLTNVLDIDAPESTLPSPVTLPYKRALKIEIEPITIGLLDAYELRKCDAFNLIAERNSILGKVQSASNQLEYEILLLASLQTCIDTLPPLLSNELQSIYFQKRSQIHSHFWNAIATDDAWQNWLRPTASSFDLIEPSTFTSAERVLSRLARIKKALGSVYDHPSHSQDETIHRNINGEVLALSSLETQLKDDPFIALEETIYQSDYLGRLYTSLHNTASSLHIANTVLSEFNPELVCGAQRDQTKADYLINIFDKYYIERLQPYIANINSEYQQLSPLLQIVYTPPEFTQSAFSDYYQSMIMGDVHRQFRAQLHGHTEYWKKLFKYCGYRVGRQ